MLTQVKFIGKKALKTCLLKGGDKFSVKLNSFESTNVKKTFKKEKDKPASEIDLLQRVSQAIAAEGENCLQGLLGEHECTEFLPSLFDFEGRMRKGNKSTLLKVILEDTQVKCLDELPNETIRWSFHPSEKFKDVKQCYRDTLLRDVPTNTSSIHFRSDRYDQVPSLKAMERTRQGKSGLQKLYDIQNHLSVPVFRDLVLAMGNKAALLSFLSSSWSGPRASSPVPLYLSGGFTEKSKTTVVDEKGVRDITTLGSTR